MFYPKNRPREKKMNKSSGISILDAKDRQAATFDADAKKARHEVREGRHFDLVKLALALIKIVSAPSIKQKLQKVVHEYEEARAYYNKSENLADTYQPMTWPTAGNGFVPDPPGYAYPHKAGVMTAWNALLAAVNETTKVGVQRWRAEDPIELQHNVGDDGPKLHAGGVSWN